VRELLPQQLFPEDIVVTEVRPAGGRPWPRAQVTFRLVDLPPSWSGPTTGSAYFPLAQEWRDACGYVPDDYVLMLASEVEAAAVRAFNPPPPSPPLTPEQVSERWQWLLERLALSGPVRHVAPSRLVVGDGAESSFTALVTPEEWAQIATLVEPDADDPQDFGWHENDEIYLVFYEDHLAWSIRPELPPVRRGAEIRRRSRAAVAQGETNIGWFAYPPTVTQPPDVE
jgi:hypothetical protein